MGTYRCKWCGKPFDTATGKHYPYCSQRCKEEEKLTLLRQREERKMAEKRKEDERKATYERLRGKKEERPTFSAPQRAEIHTAPDESRHKPNTYGSSFNKFIGKTIGGLFMAIIALALCCSLLHFCTRDPDKANAESAIIEIGSNN